MGSKVLLWLQERVKLWTRPATSILIIGILSDLPRSRSDLLAENALLCQQLIVLKRQVKQPQLTGPDRFWIVFLSHFSGFWKQALHIIQPDTLLRWHREMFDFYWKRKSQGQPKISAEMIDLIRKMAVENCLWGAERIRGELLTLGIAVSKRTIQKYMPKDRSSHAASHIVPMPLRETWQLS
jgi:putative transposase